ncbi:MAG: response regulator transcription factor [Anaerolineales bacterium]|nr:response regulator transcription factor [Anaerolineales bacterium]MCB8936922.1 response regulator transcription factor [Ardenticatenaceae bacterium]
MKQRILLVDDHDLLRAGMHALLGDVPELEVVGEATNGCEAILLAEQLSPDIILLDISLPDVNGLELAQELLCLVPTPQILLVTVHEDKVLLQKALELGISGYILKKASKTELVYAIQTIMRGEIYVHPALTHFLFTSKHEKKAVDRGQNLDLLTNREVDVLRLLVSGYTNRQIADQLTLSVRTIETHRANLTTKLDLHTRLDLIRFAAQHNLVTTE